MPYVDKVHPNLALASAATIYPLLFRFINPSTSSAGRFVRSREAISVTHCVLILSATIFELRRQHRKWFPPTLGSITSALPRMNGKPYGGQVDMIEASPPFTNAIISFELGYLIQDFVFLVLGAWRVAGYAQARSVIARNVNWRVLGWHHLGLATALGMFHLRVLRGQEKGSLVILMMLLMNASTPIGTLYWFLTKFHPSWLRSICITHGLYLLHCAVARVYLLSYILKIYGAWIGQSAIGSFAHLRWQCKLGTGVIGTATTVWLVLGVRKFIKKIPFNQVSVKTPIIQIYTP